MKSATVVIFLRDPSLPLSRYEASSRLLHQSDREAERPEMASNYVAEFASESRYYVSGNPIGIVKLAKICIINVFSWLLL